MVRYLLDFMTAGDEIVLYDPELVPYDTFNYKDLSQIAQLAATGKMFAFVDKTVFRPYVLLQ